jgi:outer membrane receptor protein involved in Fe transport
MLNFKKDNLFFEGFNVNLLLGQQINQRRFQNTLVNAAQLNIPNFFNASNASVFTGSGEAQSLRRLVGYYGQLSLSYKNMVFVELSGRMDQSSTLPTNANTFFYPAASISLVLTEMFNVDPSILSLAKIRANYAVVGRDADPYLLQTVFVSGGYGNNLASITFPLTVGSGTFPGFGPSARIGNQNLKPEFVTSYEIGTNLGFLKNRINVEFNYFYTLSTDQILNVSIPLSSGFGTRTTNVGSMRNEGIELLVGANILNIGGFRWDMSLNYTRIRNKVLSIAPGINQFAIPGNGFIGITPSIVLNRPYGMVVSSAFPRNPAGDLLINPVTGGYNPAVAGVPISDPNPNWNGGINNTFSYKGLALSFLFDTQQGGQLYSFAAQDLKALGALHMTGENRNLPRILPGVIANPDGSFSPNNIQLTPQAYWGALGGLASEAAVFDATRYSLRELTFGYSLPKSVLQKTPFGDITFSIVGRNLWFYAPGFPGDPETNTQGAGNIRGMDLNGPLNTRNYGFNLRITL